MAAMRGWLVVVYLAAGCNQVFGLEDTERAPDIGGGTDLDLDGVSDDQDPCLASAQDAVEDTDRDMLTNLDDPCPWDDAAQTLGDADQDKLPNECDPFRDSAGDTRRCTMRFLNPDLNARLWHERDGTSEWIPFPGALTSMSFESTASVVSTIDVVGMGEPTLDVDLIIHSDPSITHAVQTWARAADATSPNDLGCELSGNTTYTRLAIVLGDGRDLASQMIATPFPLAAGMRMRLTYAADTVSPNLRCTVSRYPDQWTVTASTALPPGRIGFGVVGGQLQVTGLAIYDRTSPLPVP